MSASPEHSSKAHGAGDAATLPDLQIRCFASYLREHGFLIGLGELDAMLRITLLLNPSQYSQLKSCWRGLVCSTSDQWRKYPDLFEAFWFPHRVRGSTKSSGVKRKNKSLQSLVAQMHSDMGAAFGQSKPSVGLDVSGQSGEGNDGFNGVDGPQAMGGASKTDPLNSDVKQWMPEDSAQLEALIRPLEQRLRKKLMRKWIQTHKTHRIDIPATIRLSLATDGELLRLKRKQRGQRKPRIYVLVDVSKSMESHAAFFLRIGRVFHQLLNARVFVFHTRLTEVSALLTSRNGRIQEKINAVTFGFGGGTKIATNLEAFLKIHVGRALGSRDLVYVLSDGYDTDPAEQTERAIRAIRQRGAKLFWLHPNKEQPASEAMVKSAHLITQFMAISSLQSLENLVNLH
jgi:uncharacterized protein with von Willebrand factor type A (vWA) domain